MIIAAYGAGETLAAAIESALAQTEPPHEIIVVDDGSPDGQAAIAALYSADIVYVSREKNGGEATAKDTGASVATGDFVVTLDADDTWHERRIEAIADQLAGRPDLDIVTTDAMIVLDGRRIRRYYGGPTGATWAETDQRYAILERNFIFSHAAVRRSRWIEVGGLETGRRDHAADWPFWVKLILTGSRAGFINEPLANYTLTTGSLSASATTRARTREVAMATAVSVVTATANERFVAERNLADARRQLYRLGALRKLWRYEQSRAQFVHIALNNDYRKRHRGEALLAAVFPQAVRRRMGTDPDIFERS